MSFKHVKKVFASTRAAICFNHFFIWDRVLTFETRNFYTEFGRLLFPHNINIIQLGYSAVYLFGSQMLISFTLLLLS